MKINSLLFRLFIVTVVATGFFACSDDDKKDDPTPVATCIDGIMNQNETGIDCGGVCPPCVSCFDGILNQNELGIDCGGVCPPCSIPSVTAKVDNISWNAGSGISTSNSPSTTITIIGISTAGTRITINYSGPFVTGTTNHGSTYTLEYRDAGGTVYGGISGTIKFSEFNTTTKRVSGTFSGNVKYNVGNVTKTITDGIFSNVGY